MDFRSALARAVLTSLSAFSPVALALDYGMTSRICLAEAIPFDKQAPVPVGCEIIDCCPGCPGAGPIEWRITLDAKIMTRAELRFEGLGARELRKLKIGGAAKLDGERILLSPGGARISGLPYEPGAQPAVGLLRASAPAKSAKRMSSAFGPRGPQSITDEVLVQQFLGPVLVNSFNWRINIRPCIRPPRPPLGSGEDKLKLTGNDAGDEVVVMLDGRTTEGCRDGSTSSLPEWVFSSTGESPLGNVLSPGSCNSEVAVFSKKHAMKWEKAVSTWTDSPGDVHTTPLDPLIEAAVHIWVADDVTADLARTHIENARVLYLGNRVGVKLVDKIQKFADVSNSPPDPMGIISAGVDDEGIDCLALGPIQGSALYVSNALNVYYVNKGFKGRNCAIKYPPTVCPANPSWYPRADGNITFIGTWANSTTLAHEIGHAYGLRPALCGGHTSVYDNLMRDTGDTERTTFTLGQVFRMNTHAEPSWGGTTLIPNNLSATRVGRDCAPDAPRSATCPSLMLSWP